MFKTIDTNQNISYADFMDKIPQNLNNALLSMGFSEKEANVYLALLELGKGAVSNIARKAGLNRTTGYHILDSLAGKGLVSISGKEPLQEYVAESPEKITQLLKAKFDEYEKYLKSYPAVCRIVSVKEIPDIELYKIYTAKKEKLSLKRLFL